MQIDKYKNNISEKDITRARINIQRVIKFINDYSKNHPDLNKDELLEKLEHEFINNANEYFFVIERLGGSYVQSIVVDKFLENEQLLKDEYKKIKYKPIQSNPNDYYTYDVKKSAKLLLKQCLCVIRQEAKKYKIPSENNQEYSLLKKSLRFAKSSLLENQKEDNIRILMSAKHFLEQYDILESLVLKYNKQLKSLWLEDLSYSMDSKNLDMGVNNLLSKENLQKMAPEELAILNMFWQNKYAKELLNIGFAHFAFRQLDLFDKLSDETIKIDDKTIKNLILKYNILEKISEQIYNCKIHGKDYHYIIDNLSDEYKTYFSSVFPNLTNDLNDDIMQCINPILVTKNIYSIKANLMSATIVNLIGNKKLKNWGYINDNEIDKQNTIKSKSKFILIGIDYPGLNRPVCVHIDRNQLQDIFINSNQEYLIPIYEGDEDFNINFEHLKTHIVLPLEKSHKVFLRNIPKDNGTLNFNTLLLRHTAFLANQDKFPEHLKQEQNGKKVRVRKYINLFSGDIFVEQGKKIVPENVEDRDFLIN